MSGSIPPLDKNPYDSANDRPGLTTEDDPNDPGAISPDVIAPDMDKPTPVDIGPL